jgi:hypothetical protein
VTVARWTETPWGYRAATQDALMRSISRIGTLSLDRRYVWRGVKDHRWTIRTSIFRVLFNEMQRKPDEREIRERELLILRQAREWGIGLELGASATDLHLLATLQHHGVPTRLLDVTSNPMTSLWFACQKASPIQDVSGVLFAFDVTNYPKYEAVDYLHKAMSMMEAEYGASAGLVQATAESWRTGVPFVLQPTIRNERMKAQEGLFLGGGMPSLSLVSYVDDLPLPNDKAPGQARLHALFSESERSPGRPASLPFCALVIPALVKRQMRSHLAGTYSISNRTLFPDVDGLREALHNGTGPPVTLEPGEPQTPADLVKYLDEQQDLWKLPGTENEG